MSLLPKFAENLAQMGANIEITKDAGYLAPVVEKLVEIVVTNGGHITIDATGYLPNFLEGFVRAGGNSVTIRV